MENNFKFYNTLTRQVDTVIPRVDGKIGMEISVHTSWRMYLKRRSDM